MFNARRLALALRYVRSHSVVPSQVDKDTSLDNTLLVSDGTVIVDNQDLESDEYTDDDSVTMRFEDGTIIRLDVVLVQESHEHRTPVLRTKMSGQHDKSVR